MGIYHKTSEHSLDRGTISYVEKKNSAEFDRLTDELIDLLGDRNFDKNAIASLTKKLAKLYSPIPGMEYHHKIANQMDEHGIDQVIVESGSKGATLMPVDTEEDGFNLSNSMVVMPSYIPCVTFNVTNVGSIKSKFKSSHKALILFVILSYLISSREPSLFFTFIF